MIAYRDSLAPLVRPVLLAGVGFLTACTPATQQRVDAAAASPAGQLYCAVRTVTGPMVIAAINAEASKVGAAPVAIIATGLAKATVDDICARAGGIAVSPPAGGVAPNVAVKV